MWNRSQVPEADRRWTNSWQWHKMRVVHRGIQTTSTCWNPPLSCFLCGMVGALPFYWNDFRSVCCNSWTKIFWDATASGAYCRGPRVKPEEEEGGVPSQERRHAHCGPAAHRRHHFQVQSTQFLVHFSFPMTDLVIAHLNQGSSILHNVMLSLKKCLLYF